MESTIGNAFFLLMAGMATVFLILTLVVIAGKLLIKWVNQMSPAIEKPKDSLSLIDPKVEATLQLIVQKATKGRAQIESIEKI